MYNSTHRAFLRFRVYCLVLFAHLVGLGENVEETDENVRYV